MSERIISMELAYLISSNKTLRDEETLKTSVIDVFDVLVIPKLLPSLFTSFTVFGKILGLSAGKFIGKIEVVNSKEIPVAEVSLEGELNEGDLSLRAVFNLVKFDESGRYFLRTTVNGKKLDDRNHFYFDVIKEA